MTFRKWVGQITLAAIIGTTSVHAAQAQSVLYDCTMAGVEAGLGWISPKIAIVLKSDGTAQVIDAITITFEKEPVQAKILRNDDTRLIVRWVIENARTDTGKSFNNFGYRASIRKSTGKIELTARPRHFDTGLRSGGSCTTRRQ